MSAPDAITALSAPNQTGPSAAPAEVDVAMAPAFAGFLAALLVEPTQPLASGEAVLSPVAPSLPTRGSSSQAPPSIAATTPPAILVAAPPGTTATPASASPPTPASGYVNPAPMRTEPNLTLAPGDPQTAKADMPDRPVPDGTKPDPGTRLMDAKPVRSNLHRTAPRARQTATVDNQPSAIPAPPLPAGIVVVPLPPLPPLPLGFAPSNPLGIEPPKPNSSGSAPALDNRAGGTEGEVITTTHPLTTHAIADSAPPVTEQVDTALILPPVPPDPALVQAASPTNRPMPPSGPAPAEQLAPVLISIARDPSGERHMTLQIQPEALGHLQIQIDHTPGSSLRVQIIVERPETLALLQRDTPQLLRALDQAGVLRDGMTFNFHAASAAVANPLPSDTGAPTQFPGFGHPNQGFSDGRPNRLLAQAPDGGDHLVVAGPAATARGLLSNLDIIA